MIEGGKDDVNIIEHVSALEWEDEHDNTKFGEDKENESVNMIKVLEEKDNTKNHGSILIRYII